MKGSRFSFLMVLVPLLMLCFISVPVFSGGGDEDPWDADNTGNSDGTYHDTIPTTDMALDFVPGDPDVTYDWMTNLIFSITLNVVDFFYGGTTQSENLEVEDNRDQSVESTSMANTSRN